MNDEKREQLGEGVVYKDTVPLGWREANAAELEFTFLSRQDANEEVLRSIATLDEFHVDVQDENGGYASADLSRIEYKIDLLLDMVTRLVVRETTMPDAVPITLGSAGIEWSSPMPPEADSLLELSLYLHHKYPRPLVVVGRVADVTPLDGEEEGYLVRLIFEAMSDAVQSALEKLIFRQHRRSVAHSRRNPR